MKKIKIFCVMNVGLAIAVGSLIYIFNSDDRILSNLFGFSVENQTLSVLSGYIPDFLWGYALCSALCIFNGEGVACVISTTFGILWEILQFLGAVRGTGDVIDMILYLTASLTAVMIIKIQKRRYSK